MLSPTDILIISAGLSTVMLAVLVPLYSSGMQGVREWFWANVLLIAAVGFFSFGKHAAPFFEVELAHAVYGLSMIAVVVGYRNFFGRKRHLAWLAGALSLLVIVLAVFHYWIDLNRIRLLAMALFHGSLAFVIWRTVAGARNLWHSRNPYLFAQAVAILLTLGCALRIFIQLPYIYANNAAAPFQVTGPIWVMLAMGALLLPSLTLAGSMMAHDRMMATAMREARQDFLTGAWTRRAVVEFAQREIMRARRKDRPLALLIVDIDNFKAINDSLGHSAGDTVLKDVAHRSAAILRDIDYFARMGGDEFAVLLTDTNQVGALAIAERLRHECEQKTDATPCYTISIGVAMFENGYEWKDLLANADAALYEAKNAGRNTVTLQPAQNCELVCGIERKSG